MRTLETQRNLCGEQRRRFVMWMGISLILLVPLVAMQFTDEVKWTGFDFAVAAGLLIGAGLAYELAARRMQSRRHRLAIGAVLVLLVAVIWAEGAVGILS